MQTPLAAQPAPTGRDTPASVQVYGALRERIIAFALPPGSELREPLNRSLLELLASPEWGQRRREWIGK